MTKPFDILRTAVALVSFAFIYSSCTTTKSSAPKETRRPTARKAHDGTLLDKETLFFAGIVLLGDEKQLPHSSKIIQDNKNYQELNAHIRESFADFEHPEFRISDPLKKITSVDQPIAFVFAIDSESVLEESFEGIKKLTVDLSGQIIIFDWKDKLILASYPVPWNVNASRVGSQDHQSFIKNLFRKGWEKNQDGSEKDGFMDHFVRRLREEVTLTWYEKHVGGVGRVGVGNVMIDEVAKKHLPEKFKSDAGQKHFESYIAQQFLLYLSKTQNIATLPYGGSNSNDPQSARTLKIVPGGGAMSKQFDGTRTVGINELTIPNPDYAIDLTLHGFAKQEAAKSNIDTLYLFGCYFGVKAYMQNIRTREILEVYFNENFKHALQQSFTRGADFDTWRWLNGSMLVFFQELTQDWDNPSSKWCKSHANGTSTQKTLRNFYNQALNKCKKPLPQ